MLMVKESTGRILYIQTYKGETVGDIRQYLCEQHNFLKDQVRISHNSQELQDDYVFDSDDVFELFCFIPSTESGHERFFQEKKETFPVKKANYQLQENEIEPCPRRITKPVQNQTERIIHKTKIHHISVAENKNNSSSKQPPFSLSALLN